METIPTRNALRRRDRQTVLDAVADAAYDRREPPAPGEVRATMQRVLGVNHDAIVDEELGEAVVAAFDLLAEVLLSQGVALAEVDIAREDAAQVAS